MPDDVPAQPPATDASQAGLDQLLARVRALEAINRQLTASAALQVLRAGSQGTAVRDLHRQIRLMQGSTIWRATWPLRMLLDLARGGSATGSAEAQAVRRLLGVARRQGIAAAFLQLREGLARRAEERREALGEDAPGPMTAAFVADDSRAASRLLAPSVLIIAEVTLPQCAKYRVWQKQAFFARLGLTARVVDWRDTDECFSAAALATQAILYRVPGFPPVLRLIEHLRALGVPLAWEVDDLIFDHDLFLQNRNVQELDEELRKGVISGVEFYRSAMLACGAGIASTRCLAEAMRQVGLADVTVVENALDADTLSLADRYRRRRGMRRDTDGRVVIIYGSGTKTHNADFRQAGGALLRLLRMAPRAHLRIVGELQLDSAFVEFADRVEILPPCSFPRFMQLLAESDISIAPLEPGLFNDAKSNIKFLEAAILGVACVCSPRAEFADVVEHDVNGLLADSEEGWLEALGRLVADAGLRERLGQAALRTAGERFDPDRIARGQVSKLVARAPDQRAGADLRVLFANIYFAPRSFGGATLVVEEMARRLHAMPGTEVHVVTGLAAEVKPRVITRTDQDGMAVFALPVAEGDIVAEFDNPEAGIRFGQVLDAVQPDVVHLHAVQWLSASLALACLERKIPYVITLHDAWWLCARQFMVQANGRYCFQERIDLHVCQTCMQGARHLEHRAALMRAALDGAALLLSPSEAHRQLYLANGILPEKIEVAPNGVRLPRGGGAERRRGERLRFAYVGGDVLVKGFAIVKAAFEALDRDDWELVLVDNTQNLGFSTLVAEDWTVRGKLTIVPAYTQEGIDAFYAGVDVLLFPSQWKESFGLTVREALARGVWVIATEGGGPAEAISHGGNGTLIPLDGRHEGLLEAVTSLLDEPARLDNFVRPADGVLLDHDRQAAALHATLTRVAGTVNAL